jgi:hypothetical protein
MAIENRMDSWSTNGPTNPRWEPISRLAVRLNSGPVPSGAAEAQDQTTEAAIRLLGEANGNDLLLREALAVFVAGADKGVIGSRASESLRAAIRLGAQQSNSRSGLKRLINR